MSDKASIHSRNSQGPVREHLSVPLVDDTSSLTQAGLRQTSLMTTLDAYSQTHKKKSLPYASAPLKPRPLRLVEELSISSFTKPHAPALGGRRLQRQSPPSSSGLSPGRGPPGQVYGSHPVSPHRSYGTGHSPMHVRVGVSPHSSPSLSTRTSVTSHMSSTSLLRISNPSLSDALLLKVDHLEQTLDDLVRTNEALQRTHESTLAHQAELEKTNLNISNENSMLLRERAKLKSELANLSHELSRSAQIVRDQERTIKNQRAKRPLSLMSRKSQGLRMNLQYEVLREEEENEEEDGAKARRRESEAPGVPRVPPRPLSAVLSLCLSRSTDEETMVEESLGARADMVEVSEFTIMGDTITSWQDFVKHYRTLRAKYDVLKLEVKGMRMDGAEVAVLLRALAHQESLTEEAVVAELGHRAAIEEMEKAHAKRVEEHQEALTAKEATLRVLQLQLASLGPLPEVQRSLAPMPLLSSLAPRPVPDSSLAKHVDALFRHLGTFTALSNPPTATALSPQTPSVGAAPGMATTQTLYHDSYTQLVKNHLEGMDARNHKIATLTLLLAAERRLVARLCLTARGASLADDEVYTDVSSNTSISDPYTPNSEISSDELFECKLPDTKARRRVGLRVIDVGTAVV